MTRSLINNTVSVTAVIGVTPGYFHANENIADAAAFGTLYQEVADKVFSDTNMYCGAVVSPCKVIYRTAWGCPVGGENAIRVTADCNPSYDKERAPAEYIAAWKEAFLTIVETLMAALDQTTVTVSFSDGEMVYLSK